MKKILLCCLLIAVVLCSCDDSGIEEIVRSIPTKLETPTDVLVDETKTTASSLLITWSGLEREDVESYIVAYAPAGNSADYTEVKVYSSECPITGLQMSTAYRVRVKANSSEGDDYNSDWTEDVEGATIEIFLPDAPSNITVETEGTTSSHLALVWDEVPHAKSYIVAYKSTQENDYTEAEAETPRFTIRGLIPESEYEVKVKSCSQSGEEYNSDYSYTVTGTTISRSAGIFNGDDLADFASEVSSGAKDGGDWKNPEGQVVINRDIDMEGIEWVPAASFNGTLEGGGNKISNLVYSSSSTRVGIFALLSGTVKDVVVDSSCQFTSTATLGTVYTGAIAGELLPGAELYDCENHGAVSGGSSVGGIAGASVSQAAPTVIVSGCKNYGTVKFPSNLAPYGNVMVGGIVGSTEIFTTVTGCTNYGTSTNEALSGNFYSRVGGIVGNGSDTHFSECENAASGMIINAANDFSIGAIGGITGCSFRSTFESCVNNGRVSAGSSASSGDRQLRVGGIVGSSEGANTEEIYITACRNNSPISVSTEYNSANHLGGIVGYVTSRGIVIEECVNTADLSLSAKTGTSRLGGIVGMMNAATGISTVKRESMVLNCENTGTITSSSTASPWLHAAGIAGSVATKFTTMSACTNRGDVMVLLRSRACGGGIVCENKGLVTGCKNYGTISAPNHNDYYSNLGGIVARNEDDADITNSINYGNILYSGVGDGNSEMAGYVGFGGIVGLLQYGSVASCENYGTILDVPITAGGQTLRGAKGSICGWASDKAATKISGCKVGGALGEYDGSAPDKGISAATPLTAATFPNHIYGRANNTVTVTDCTFGSN